MADEKNNKTQLKGLCLIGTLLTAEPTKSGKNDSMSWGASVKLKFLVKYTKKTDLRGEVINSNASDIITISIASTDDALVSDFDHYQKLEGQELSLPLVPPKNATFKIFE